MKDVIQLSVDRHGANLGFTHWKELCSGPDIARYELTAMSRTVRRAQIGRRDIPNTWKIANDLDIELLQQLGATNTRALQDLSKQISLLAGPGGRGQSRTYGVPRVPELNTTHFLALTYTAVRHNHAK